MASITEVARRAGVSIATASRVVGAVDYPVSPQTRQRVLEAARELDYVPNALARGLLKSKMPVVGVIVHDITDPYFAELVRGVEDAASQAGYLVITCSTEQTPERETSHVRLLRAMRAAAVIFAGSGRDDPLLSQELPKHVAAMREAGSAVVHLSPHVLGQPEISIDNVAGFAALVAALVEMGHRQIALLAGPAELFVARERLAGYRRGLAAAGIEVDERLIVHSSFDHEGGAAGIDRLLGSGAPFTAVCGTSDMLALGALQRLHQHGMNVPGDVSVAGFDDISIATMTAPSLTTVHIPLRELGRLGFRYAAGALDGEDVAPQVLPTKVVLRASTGPPRSAARRTGVTA